MLKPRLLRALLVPGLLLSVLAAQPAAAVNQRPRLQGNPSGWQIQVVAARGITGLYSDLVLDANGYPRLSYLEEVVYLSGPRNHLVYARWDGSRWLTEVVDYDVSRDPVNDTPEYTSLELDPGGNPHLAYADDEDLHYAYWDGAQWVEATLDSGPGPVSQASLALNAKGWPHISYSKGNDLWYAAWNGAAWQLQLVHTNLIANNNSLALDLSGRPHISYVDNDADVLRYATRNGGLWLLQTVDASAEIDGRTSLALASDQSPHIGYLTDAGLLKYASWTGTEWISKTVANLGTTAVDIGLALDGASNPHLIYSGYASESLPLTHLRPVDAAWFSEVLDPGDGVMGQHNAVAVDADGNLHASYFEDTYDDLRYVTWAPNWQTRTVAAGVVIPTTDVEARSGGPLIGAHNDTANRMALATGGNPWAIDAFDIVTDTVTQASLALGAGTEYLSYYDPDYGRLMYAHRTAGEWGYHVVEDGVNTGRYNDLVLVGHYDGHARLAYWDGNDLQIKLAVLEGTHPPIVYPNTDGPALDAQSGRLSAAVLTEERIAVSYYDAVNGDLRLAVWDPVTEGWTDELVTGATTDAGLWNALQTDATTGDLVLAYYDNTDDSIYLAYQVAGAWTIEPTPAASAVGFLNGLALELGLNSVTRPRIAYLGDEGTSLSVVSRQDGGEWLEETIASGGLPRSGLSMAVDERLHLAYGDGGLTYAFRSATLHLAPEAPGNRWLPGDSAYNPMDACMATLHFFLGGEDDYASGRSLFSYAPAAPLGLAGPLDDQAIFMAMDHTFHTSPAGEAYIDLYAEHGGEMGQIGLEDPDLMWDAYGTLQNFMPGLEALLTGNGDEQVVTQAMVDDALDIWQRIAAAASPELAGEINTRLALYNNLQDFVGLTFAEWAAAIGVHVAVSNHTLYLPVVGR